MSDAKPFKAGDEVAFYARYDHLPIKEIVEKVHKNGRVVVGGQLYRPDGMECGPSWRNGFIHHWCGDDDAKLSENRHRVRAAKVLEALWRRRGRSLPFTEEGVAALEAAADIVAPDWNSSR